MARARRPKEYLELKGSINNQVQYKNYHPSLSLPTRIGDDTQLQCPSKYCKRTKEAWQTIVPALLALKVLNIQDLAELEMLFTTHEQYVKSEEALRKFMKTFDPMDFNQVKHMKALNTAMNESINTFGKIANRFGITPVERTKLAYSSEEKEDDPLSVVLGE